MQGERARTRNVTHGYDIDAFSLSFRRQAYETAVVAQHEFIKASVRAVRRLVLRAAVPSHPATPAQAPA